MTYLCTEQKQFHLLIPINATSIFFCRLLSANIKQPSYLTRNHHPTLWTRFILCSLLSLPLSIIIINPHTPFSWTKWAVLLKTILYFNMKGTLASAKAINMFKSELSPTKNYCTYSRKSPHWRLPLTFGKLILKGGGGVKFNGSSPKIGQMPKAGWESIKEKKVEFLGWSMETAVKSR